MTKKPYPQMHPKMVTIKPIFLVKVTIKQRKTPQWASQITGIPEDRIIKLAREIGTAKPAYICRGWGATTPGANGELTARAIAMLPILTGNVGISGGNSGARESTYTITIERLPVLDNPVKTSISCFSWTDAIDHGPQMTAIRDGVRGKDKLDVPIKFIWNYAGNTLVNQHSDINKTHEILQDESKCEMIVVIENFMTSSAKYADILLPDLMTVEQEDIIPNDYAGNMGYLIFLQPVTSEKFERKPIYWILSEVAKRLGPDVYQKVHRRSHAGTMVTTSVRQNACQRSGVTVLRRTEKKWVSISVKIPMAILSPTKHFVTTPRQIHLKRLPVRLKFIPAGWRKLPVHGNWKKMK